MLLIILTLDPSINKICYFLLVCVICIEFVLFQQDFFFVKSEIQGLCQAVQNNRIEWPDRVHIHIFFKNIWFFKIGYVTYIYPFYFFYFGYGFLFIKYDFTAWIPKSISRHSVHLSKSAESSARHHACCCCCDAKGTLTSCGDF